MRARPVIAFVAAASFVVACMPVAPSAPLASVGVNSAVTATTPPSSPAMPTTRPTAALGGDVEARYADGLPSQMGDTPVFRGEVAIAHAATLQDDSPFLVAGWATYFGQPVSCALFFGPYSSWRNRCGQVRFSDVAGAGNRTIDDAITFRFAVDGPLLGPVVAVVHVHDARADTCDTDRAICDGIMVVDRIVWRGDSATEPAPVTRASLVSAIDTAQGTIAAPFGPTSQNAGCDLPGLYTYALHVPDDVTPKVICAVAAPSIEALRRALDQADGAAAALRPKAVQMESWSKLHNVVTAHVTDRWLVVENVALMVRTQAEPTTKDRRFLDQLVAALQP